MVVKFFAYIRDYTHTKEINFEPCATVEELLQKLSAEYGKKFEDKVFPGGVLSDEIIILINGRHISHFDSVKTQLHEDDEISIFPVVAGG